MSITDQFSSMKLVVTIIGYVSKRKLSLLQLNTLLDDLLDETVLATKLSVTQEMFAAMINRST